ncbi:MAG: nicotinamide-nucleotide adenylyltransferase [Promethearchaeota archaeon]
MEKEILACIEDENIKYLHSGQISKYVFPLERTEAHEKRVSHLIIRFFIMAFTPDNETAYLVQKRGKNKKSYPGFYTDSASGHVIYSPNLELNDIKENAIRELEEEFGISPKNIKKIILHDLNTEQDNFTKEIAYIFFGLVDYNVKLKPNPKELEINESRFYSKRELEILLSNEKAVDYSKRIWNYLIHRDALSIFEKNHNFKKSGSQNVALFIGRFQPLHHGHIYVIYRILESHKKLKIGIGSSQLSETKNDPFTSAERIEFIKTAFEKRNISKNKYEIYEIPDIFNAQKWVDHVVSIVGDFDVIYSNSDWVRQLFRNKGYMVGKKLGIFKKKYNASNIRKLIGRKNKNWTSLVPKEVANLMKEFNGIERIQSLYEISEEA